VSDAGVRHAALGEVVALMARDDPWETVLPQVAALVAGAVPYATVTMLVRTPTGDRALVAAFADGQDSSAPDLEVELSRHGELREALQRTIRHDNAPGNLLADLLGWDADDGALDTNLVAIPIRLVRRGQGVLLLTFPYPTSQLSAEQLDFCHRIADACAHRVAELRRTLGREAADLARISWLDSDAIVPSWSEADDASELHELLVNLVEHSADAIVASDMDGTIRVFNRSAERLFGYESEGIIGGFHVEHLTLPGVAREHMRLMRSDEAGETGSLQTLQTEIVASDGEIIPVSLSAAILYEGGEEIATVGIFHDLRERLALESRLEQMSAQLVQTEKQATLAALAGTAAHELNQPLTAIMGLVELLQLSAEGATANQLDKVYRETERMSEIVRRIGRITRFSTKKYVGDTEILDLEESSEVK